MSYLDKIEALAHDLKNMRTVHVTLKDIFKRQEKKISDIENKLDKIVRGDNERGKTSLL